MKFKVLIELNSEAKHFLVLSSKPVNLNKGLAKRVLNSTLAKIDNQKSPFINYGDVVSLERVPKSDDIKIISKIDGAENTHTFTISQEKSDNSYYLTGVNSKIMSSDLIPTSILDYKEERILAIKEKLYNALMFIKDINKKFNILAEK